MFIKAYVLYYIKLDTYSITVISFLPYSLPDNKVRTVNIKATLDFCDSENLKHSDITVSLIMLIVLVT